ncbi:MAG: Crp/Fnr family transcriptional regulator [Bacteroidetes bacterium]|nr:Crp/Fnr family transcriptional regulator [Bacteroidota bacterium]MBK8146015.1 Crp/Fnr family transcriptional regulator [Bacteroidota bacterium]
MDLGHCSYDCRDCPNCRISVFSDLKNDDFEKLNYEKSVVTLHKGQVLFLQDSKPHGLYCIKKGKVKIYRRGSEGKEQIVRLANDADVVGYRALLSNENYQCGAAALEETTLCYVPKHMVEQLMEDNTVIYKKMVNLLASDLKQAEHKLSDLAQKPVRERVAESLFLLKGKYGLESDGQTLNVVLSREELANIVGTATESLIRVLSDFKKEGIVELEQKRIKILDEDHLFRTAHLYD